MADDEGNEAPPEEPADDGGADDEDSEGDERNEAGRAGPAGVTTTEYGTTEGVFNSRGQHHGLGKASYVNGDSYEGNYEYGKRSGHGVYRYADRSWYEGYWKNGMKHSYGVYTYPNYTRYEGEWEWDKRCGRGKYYYSNGDTYDGLWKDHVRNGRGKYCYKASGMRYIGGWKNGQRDGRFCTILRASDDKEEPVVKVDIYPPPELGGIGQPGVPNEFTLASYAETIGIGEACCSPVYWKCDRIGSPGIDMFTLEDEWIHNKNEQFDAEFDLDLGDGEEEWDAGSVPPDLEPTPEPDSEDLPQKTVKRLLFNPYVETRR